jgi:hypothetical protein
MSVLQFDGFTYENSQGRQTSINVYVDTETRAITFSVVEGNLTGSYVTTAQRGMPNGTLITKGYSEDGTVEFDLYSSTSAPFAIAGGGLPVEPIPSQCDLRLYVTATSETAFGANDGKATLTASTSYGGAQYSLDGVTFGATKEFTGLAPGSYTAYSKDSNGCAANATFQIVAFDDPFGVAGTLPQVEVSPDNFSRWNAAFNPVYLEFQRDPQPNRKNFRIEVYISSGLFEVTGSWSPDRSGKIRCNISAFLQTLVNANDDFKYDVLNYVDQNRWKSFTFRYRELWDGDSSFWYNGPAAYYVTFSAKQLGDLYGGNMGDYVTFLNEPNPNFKAKFLTLFEESTAWEGLPFDLSYIRSEYLAGKQVKLRTTSLDINKQSAGVARNDYILINHTDKLKSSAVNNLIIRQGQLGPVTNSVINGATGINRLMLAGGPSPLTKYFQVQLYTGTDDQPNFITKPQIIQVIKPCKDPFIYLKWMNTLGGWDYWRFGYDSIAQMSTADGLTVDRNVFDWEHDTTITETIRKTGVEKITVSERVPQNKVKGLKGLHTSVKVMMLVRLNPYHWHTVTINPGTFDVKRARNTFSEFKLTISLPAINIQSQ